MMLYKVESAKDLESVARALESASQKHRFGVLGVHDLKAKLKEKGVDFSGDCLIYVVCQSAAGQEGARSEPGDFHGAPLPDLGVPVGWQGYALATIRPTAMTDMFNTPELRTVAAEVEGQILAMMSEAAPD